MIAPSLAPAEKTWEQYYFNIYGERASWLTWTDDGLGCSTCMGSGRSGFASGNYKIKLGKSGKPYFYARTLVDHESSMCHKSAVSRAAGGQVGVCSRADDTQVVPQHDAGCVAETSPIAPNSASTIKFRNHLLSVYPVLAHCWSRAVFRNQLLVARLQGARLWDAQDSDAFFNKGAAAIVGAVRHDVMDGLLARPVSDVSIDEKGRFLGVIVRYLTKSFVPRAVLLAYRELEGLDSPDLSRLLLSILAENNVDLDSIVSFAADGASVMGTRAA